MTLKGQDDQLDERFTDEEREAFKAAMADDEQMASGMEDDDDDLGDDDDAEGDEDDDAPAATAAQAEPAKAEAAPPVIEAPPDFDEAAHKAALDKLKADRDQILDDFDNGEISASERMAKLDAITDQIAEQVATAKQAKAAAEQFAKQSDAEFSATVKAYLAANPGLADDANLDAFDAAYVTVGRDPANQNKSTEQLLALAHRYLTIIKPDAPLPSDGARAAPKPAPAKPQRQAAPAPAEPPTTLRGMPAADIARAGDGDEFAEFYRILDTGDPDKIEKALSKMTPDQIERMGR